MNKKCTEILDSLERQGKIKVNRGFKFPEPIPLEKKLKDVLEKKVDEKYYLSDKTIKTYQRDFGSKGKLLDKEKTSSTLTASMGGGGANVPIIVDGKLDIKGQDQIKRVYDSDGLSPTLSTMQGGNRQPKIIEDFYKSRRAREYEKVAPTLRSERSGLKVAEPFVVASRGRGKDNKQHLEPNLRGTTNALTSVQKDNYIAIPVSENGISRTIRASGRGSLDRHSWDIVNHGYRIRKLTPLECWRLQGFFDDDFTRAKNAGISDTQLYKQAGNSITVDVLMAIFKELLNGS